jgi:hypothetical protein
VAQSRAQEIDALRRYAHGRFLDASEPGTYDYRPKVKQEVTERFLRGIDLSAATKQ